MSQFLGRNLAAGDARNNRIAAATLNVGQEPIICVLQRAVHRRVHGFVEQLREDCSDGRLAHLAAIAAIAAISHHLLKGLRGKKARSAQP